MSAYPELDATVDIVIVRVGEISVVCRLPEFNNVEGTVLISEISQRRESRVGNMCKVGQKFKAVVIYVDPVRGYIDLSIKRAISPLAT